MFKKRPWVYRITKVDDTGTRGLIIFTIKQDKFEPDHDRIETDPSSEDYGCMYADYYSSDVKPCVNDDTTDCDRHIITIETVNDNVKLGSSKVLTAKIYDHDGNDITDMYRNSECIWNFELQQIKTGSDLIIVDEDYSKNNKFKCKFKFNGDEQYLWHNIKVICKIDNLETSVLLDIVPL